MTHSWQAAQGKPGPRGIPRGGVSDEARLWLLGGFRVSVGSRLIEESEWRLRRAAGLVKLLALTPGHRMHREQVMERLWPDLETKAAANNLRYALHVARRVLEPTVATTSDCLRLQGGELALCPEGLVRTDVEAFEKAAATATRTRDPAAYRAAIDLYAGDLLPEDRYDRWVEDRREGLRQSYLGLLVELAGLYEERGELGLAVEALSKAVAAGPTNEEAHVGLMRLYARSGRRHEAILQYERLRNVLSEELGTEPGEASRRLHEEVRAGRLPVPQALTEKRIPVPPSREAPQHNLPVERTSFVGREEEVVEVKRLLFMTQVLTLTGTGGCGKTRLALAVARDLTGAYQDGVWIAELAALSEEMLVPQAVATAVGVHEQPGRSLIDALTAHLRAKRLLLILDNCEHLTDAVVRLVEALVGSCPNLRLLTTSREDLGVVGELVWQVPSLSVPAPGKSPAAEELSGYESVRLFVERARYRDPNFALSPRNAEAVAEICWRLDGIPLAIELAAARTGMLSAEQIAKRLGNSLKLLTGGDRVVPPRQRTLRGTLDWSYELLSEEERKLFGRLSVFAGGWTLEAVEAVGAGEGIEEGDVLDLLAQLVDKSLVTVEAGVEGAPRYRMLEPVRQYGRERLEENEEADAVRHRHATWFLELAEEAEPELRGAKQGAWLERLEAEHDNLRAALSWALERGETELTLRLAGALGEFWHMRGHLSEGRRWLEAVLAKGDAPPGPARARALARAGYIAWEQGDYERSMVLSEESLTLSRKVGDKAGVAAALYTLGWAALFRNELELASTLTEEAVTLQREMNDTVGVARSLSILGLAVNAQHDHERAMALHEEGLALAQDAGDSFAIVLSLMLGAIASLGRGDHQRTKALLKEGLELSQRLKTMHVTAGYLHISAALAGSQGLPVRSARIWGAGESLREAIGTVFSPVERHHYGPYIEAVRARLDEAAWEAAWAEGRAMTPEEAIEYALSEGEPAFQSTSPASEPPPDSELVTTLTRREEEVAILVAQGLTNRRIGEELSISEHTAATHVRNILHKLGLRSRAQIIVWVMEQEPFDKRR